MADIDKNSNTSSFDHWCRQTYWCGHSRAFSRAGYQVIIHYNRSASDADRLCEKFNRLRDNSCLLVQADLNDMAGLQKIIDLVDSWVVWMC